MNSMINNMLELLETMLKENRPEKVKTIIRETIVKIQGVQETKATVEWKLYALDSAIMEQTQKIKEANNEIQQQNQTGE